MVSDRLISSILRKERLFSISEHVGPSRNTGNGNQLCFIDLCFFWEEGGAALYVAVLPHYSSSQALLLLLLCRLTEQLRSPLTSMHGELERLYFQAYNSRLLLSEGPRGYVVNYTHLATLEAEKMSSTD